MLEGTDLSSAYQHSLVGAANGYDGESSYASFFDDGGRGGGGGLESPRQQQSKPNTVERQERPEIQQPAIPQQQSAGYDANLFNKQYEQEQRIIRAINELKKRKDEASTSSQVQTNGPAQPSYFDKLFGKKKEVGKIIQAALIVALGISIYFLIEHYLKEYLSEHDLSFERQLGLRLLFPLSILFIIWNLRVFIK